MNLCTRWQLLDRTGGVIAEYDDAEFRYGDRQPECVSRR
jgi:hypothetical protein